MRSLVEMLSGRMLWMLSTGGGGLEGRGGGGLFGRGGGGLAGGDGGGGVVGRGGGGLDGRGGGEGDVCHFIYHSIKQDTLVDRQHILDNQTPHAPRHPP